MSCRHATRRYVPSVKNGRTENPSIIKRVLLTETVRSGVDLKRGNRGIYRVDRSRIDRRMACRPGHEGRRLWRIGGHHSRHSRRRRGRLDLRTPRNLAGWWIDRLYHRGFCWRGDLNRDYSVNETGLNSVIKVWFCRRPLKALNASSLDQGTRGRTMKATVPKPRNRPAIPEARRTLKMARSAHAYVRGNTVE
jgi:hypothetical protein